MSVLGAKQRRDRTATQYPLWPDAPADIDLLGFGDIAESVVDALRREGLDPVTVGLFGSWGSGKSTVLDLVEDILDDSDIVVRVRPWEYERYDDVKALLIGEILDAIRTEEEPKLTEKLRNRFDALAGRINWSKAISLVAKGALLQVPSVDDVVNVFGSRRNETAPNLATFRKEFAEMLKELTDVRRVVVLVDDLDRCLPPAVVATLEGIKLFLSVPKMAFVVAADRRSVTLAISTNYHGASDAETLASQYVEKIVQIPVSIPRLGVQDTEAYLALMLMRDSLSDEEFRTLAGECASQRTKGAGDLLATINAPMAARLAEPLRLAKVLAPVLYRHLDGNPRRLKRFLNAYWIRSGIASRRGAPLEPAVLAKLMVLEEIYGQQFEIILTWLAAAELATKLGALETAETTPEQTEHPLLAEWARLPPPLADHADLGPYLRLAASFHATAPITQRLRSELQEIADGLMSAAAGRRRAALQSATKRPTEDQEALARYLAEATWREPSRHTAIAPSLRALIGTDDRRAEQVASELVRLPPKDVSMALAVQMLSDGPPAPLRALLRQWKENAAVPALVRAAITEGLERI